MQLLGRKKLGRKLSLFHWSAPSHPVYLPHDDAAFTDDPQVMFSSMDTLDLLEAAIGDTSPLLASSSQVVPLQPSSSSSDALPSSSVITFNIADNDPPTEDEQPKKERRVTKKERRVTFNLTDHDSPFDDEQPRTEEGAAHQRGSSQSQDSGAPITREEVCQGKNPENQFPMELFEAWAWKRPWATSGGRGFCFSSAPTGMSACYWCCGARLF